LSEYAALGLPDPGHAWSGEEMQKAAQVLTTLGHQKLASLPRYRSDRSGEVFARIISTEGWGKLTDKSIPLGRRMPDAMANYELLNAVNKLYSSGYMFGSTGDDEVVAIYCSMLRFIETFFNLVEEFVPTLDPGDPTYEVRMGGLRKMKAGFANMVVAGLMMLSDRDRIRISRRRHIVDTMQEVLPSLVPHLSEEGQDAVLSQIDSISEDPKIKVLRPDLRALRVSILRALRDQPAREL
jgi:hypothetical protein